MAEKYGRKVRELMIKEMKTVFEESDGFIFTSVEKIKASDIDVLRKKLKQAGSRYFVVKNRLAKIALTQAGISGLEDILSEQKTLGVGVIAKDPVQVAKLVVEFSKGKDGFKISKGYLDGQIIAADKVKALAKLPAREQLIAMVLGTMNAPITSFVSVLSAVPRKLLYALNAVKDKKEGK
ncbi:MAG: 50S ribosomal protein L10 [Candidatus Omnitrophica bacterium]|nr:50S ribosomal protein L10 [Candidatus Omnitrophota bacterium]